jgi:membrane-bound lytic murein transglycosylase C
MRIVSFVIGLGLSVCGGLVLAQEDTDFERLEAEQNQAFEEFEAEEEQRFNQFIQAEQQAFEQFKTEVEKLWDTYERAPKEEWVEYGDDLHTRSRVDFENGEATVEVLIEEEGEAPEIQLGRAVATTVTNPGTSADYSVSLPDGAQVQPVPLGSRPVLDGQLTTETGASVTQANAAEFAEEVLQKGGVKTEKITGKDGRQRTKVTVTFKLVPDHLRRRAERYLSIVRKYAKRFSLDVPLVFAVIHTESFFNPKARSSAPAYGLMQLVPTSGGRAAYQFVYKKDRVLPRSYFYVPDQNIELGCAYLTFVRQAYFGKIKNKEKAYYCIISAYNTGAGNVSRSFTGRTKVSEAIPMIDRLSPGQLYQHLQKKLPYEETRKYVKLVSERMELYQEWQ